MKTIRLLILGLLLGCTSAPPRNLEIRSYYLITGGDTLRIQDTLIGHSKHVLLRMTKSIDSVISKVDSTAFKVNGSTFKIQVKGTFDIPCDSLVSAKAYYVLINNGATENDFFGIYIKPLGTISLKAYESRMVLRLLKMGERDLIRLQDLTDSVIQRQSW